MSTVKSLIEHLQGYDPEMSIASIRWVDDNFTGLKFYKKKPRESSTQSSAKFDDEGNKIPITLAERREKLQKRRDKKYIEEVMKLIYEWYSLC